VIDGEEPPVSISSAARLVYLALAAFVSAALLLRLGLSVFDPDPSPGDPGVLTRVVRYFSYFTIQSNIAVLLASLAVLAAKPLAEPRWRALRLAALLGITVTGVIYVTVLAGDSDLAGWSQVANIMLHYLAPPLTVLTWLAFGPRVRFAWSDILLALIWPTLWIAYTLIRGAIVDWYPYPFIDVATHGYGKVAVNIAVITVFASVLAAVFVALERWRTRVT
jgi:hypothetical protein